MWRVDNPLAAAPSLALPASGVSFGLKTARLQAMAARLIAMHELPPGWDFLEPTKEGAAVIYVDPDGLPAKDPRLSSAAFVRCLRAAQERGVELEAWELSLKDLSTQGDAVLEVAAQEKAAPTATALANSDLRVKGGDLAGEGGSQALKEPLSSFAESLPDATLEALVDNHLLNERFTTVGCLARPLTAEERQAWGVSRKIHKRLLDYGVVLLEPAKLYS